MSRYDGERFVSFTTGDGLAHDVVTCILEDQAGDLWFGTRFGGVSRYDEEGFVSFTEEAGLVDNQVLCVFEDREGYLWFGTYGGFIIDLQDADKLPAQRSGLR